MKSFPFPDFDYNAGGGIDPRVRAEMNSLALEADANPHAPHARGRAARAVLEDARERVAGVLGVRADEIVFCSGGTEANNLALASGEVHARRRGLPMAVSTIEHPSVSVPARALREAAEVEVLELVWNRGLAVDRAVAFASCIFAQGEVGFVQDLASLRRSLEGYDSDVVVHSDASQALGRIDVAPALAHAELVTLSPHKAGGPRGVGVLVVREGVSAAPALRGGSQELGRRPGTQSPRLAHGAACAIDLARRETAQRAASMSLAMTTLLEGMADARARAWLRVLGEDLLEQPNQQILPNTRTLCFPGVEARVLLPALDMAGIGVSYGSACSSGALEPSPVLLALGVPANLVGSCLRVSFGPSVDVRKVREAASLFQDMLARFHTNSSSTSR